MPAPDRKSRSCLTAPRRAERAFRRVLSSALLHLSRAVAPGAPHRPRSARSSAPSTPHSPPQALPESENPDTDDAQEAPLHEPSGPAVHLQTETPTQPPQELAAPATVYDSPPPSPSAYATAPPEPLHDAAMDHDFALQDAPAGLNSPQFHGFLPPSQPATFGFSPQQNASALEAFAPPPTPIVISPRTALGDLGMSQFMGANVIEEVASSGPTRTPHDSPRASPYRRNSPQRTRATRTVPLPANAVASSSRLPEMPTREYDGIPDTPRAPSWTSRSLPHTASPESFEPQYSAQQSNNSPIASTSRRSPSPAVEVDDDEMEVDELVNPPAAPARAIISLPGTPFDGRFEIREDAPGLELQEGGALQLAMVYGAGEDEDDLTSHNSGDDVEVDAPQAALPEAAGNAVASSSRLPEIPTLEIEDRDMAVDAMASGPLEPPRAPRRAPLSLLGSPEYESFDSQYSAARSDSPPVASTSGVPSPQAVENVGHEEMEAEEGEEALDGGSLHHSLPAEQASVHSMSDVAGSDSEDEVEVEDVEAPHETLPGVAYAIVLHELHTLADRMNIPQPETSTGEDVLQHIGFSVSELQDELADARDIALTVQRQLEGLRGTHSDIPSLQQVLSQAINELKRSTEKISNRQAPAATNSFVVQA